MKTAHFVVNFIVVCENKVLLERKNSESIWVLPGGHVNHDENPIETIARESQEELGIGIEVLTESPMFDPKPGITSLPAPINMFAHEVSEDSSLDEPHCNIGMTYVVTTDEKPKPCEGQIIQWFSEDELQDCDTVEPIKELSRLAIQMYQRLAK